MYGPRIGAALAKPLDNFMVPKDAIVLDSLPKSENGKITRKALLALEVSP
jgi:acyl-coenzyme A synthetase/AMP-(fatty) acid ligase